MNTFDWRAACIDAERRWKDERVRYNDLHGEFVAIVANRDFWIERAADLERRLAIAEDLNAHYVQILANDAAQTAIIDGDDDIDDYLKQIRG